MLYGKGIITKINWEGNFLIMKWTERNKELEAVMPLSPNYRLRFRFAEKDLLNNLKAEIGDIIEFKGIISQHYSDAAFKPYNKIFISNFKLYKNELHNNI